MSVVGRVAFPGGAANRLPLNSPAITLIPERPSSLNDFHPRQTKGVLEPEPTIVCVDCGGPCSLLTHPREDDVWYPGDIVSYRCRDCLDRWDLVLPDEDEDGSPDPTY